MTIEESMSTPPTPTGPGPAVQDDLATLVRTLADQARAADQRSAELATRTRELTERVALLEGQRDDTSTTPEHPALGPDERLRSNGVAFSSAQSTPSIQNAEPNIGGGGFIRAAQGNSLEIDETKSSAPQDTNGRCASSRITFASDRFIENTEHNTRGLNTVACVPEDDPEEALADRVLLIERQLEDRDDVKNALDERKYELPESTFSLLITCQPKSVPFGFAVFTIALAMTCLILTLVSSVEEGMKGHRSGVPAGVGATVRAAQFIGAIVGVLMEDEIPQGLQLIANGAGHTLLLNGEKAVQKKVVISSMFRLLVGYLFLSSLFISIAQSSDVIEIFYDVLALEFVENIDDTAFALGKRGFFGRELLIATNESHDLEIAGARGTTSSATSGNTASATQRRLSFSGHIASNNRVNHLVRFVYFLNATIVLIGLGIIAYQQDHGNYRCNRVNVLFDEEIWERAHVRIHDDSIEGRLLIYSYFNGIFQEDGQEDGYPKYVEQNKNDGTPFSSGSSVRGAVIRYCEEISSWVFTHPDILTTPIEEKQNECSWLWKSPQTENYDLLGTTNGNWEAWIGEVKQLADISIACVECSERSDCNYHGVCENSECRCDENYFGDSCEFEMPCESLATEKAHSFAEGVQWVQEKPIKVADKIHRVYNRPLYVQEGLTGEPFDMRLYKIREKETTPLPSSQPSSLPSVSNGPSYFPTDSPSNTPTFPPTHSPVSGALSHSNNAEDDPETGPAMPGLSSYGEGLGEGASSEISSSAATTTPTPTQSPTKPLHNQNEYDIAPDFADWDDFFESPSLHIGLEEVLKDFKVVISYTGSRFYGTITSTNDTLEELFPPDYHAFWDQSFDVDRTFIISDATSRSSPVGVDFYEMRRRINTLFNPNVQFTYGPFGALIPLMNYQGTGFFHCLDEASQPSSSPSSTTAPTTSIRRLALHNIRGY